MNISLDQLKKVVVFVESNKDEYFLATGPENSFVTFLFWKMPGGQKVIQIHDKNNLLLSKYEEQIESIEVEGNDKIVIKCNNRIVKISIFKKIKGNIFDFLRTKNCSFFC